MTGQENELGDLFDWRQKTNLDLIQIWYSELFLL